MKQTIPVIAVNSTIYFFHDFGKFRRLLFCVKHTKLHSLHGEVRIFFPPHHEGLTQPGTQRQTGISPRNTTVVPLNAVKRVFRQFWAFKIAKKVGCNSAIC